MLLCVNLVQGSHGQQFSREHKRNKGGGKKTAISNHDNTAEVAKNPVRESEMDSSFISVEKTPSKYQQKKAKKQVCLIPLCAVCSPTHVLRVDTQCALTNSKRRQPEKQQSLRPRNNSHCKSF